MTADSVLVTGGTGFIGRHVLARLGFTDHYVRATCRSATRKLPQPGVEWIEVADIGADTDWREALRGIRVVVHLAARAHVMRDSTIDPLGEFRRVNVAGTERLARAAADAGACRFVFVSSVKVNGERTAAPFIETDVPRPEDAYGLSKLEAEQALTSIAAEQGMEVVIVRPPLVFGEDAPGNFARLMAAITRGLPIPFGAVDNRRSLVNVQNLADFLLLCCEHPKAAGEAFFVADEEDISTAMLVRRLAEGLGRNPRLIPVPEAVIRLVGRIAGLDAHVDRLLSSLQISTAKAQRLLVWRAPVGIHEGLVAAARNYSRSRSQGIRD